MRLAPTPSQTVGPYFGFALHEVIGAELVPPDAPGAVRIEGAVLDGAGEPVPDAMVEIWQANAAGRYAHPADARVDLPLEEGFVGFGRSGTDEHGVFRFVTVKPGRVPAADGTMQAPHLDVSVFARGLLKRLVTRMYFPDEAEANAIDPVLALVPSPDERATLIARAEGDGLRFDVRLQGDGQTVFFAV
jgi:protocatechuate 3,4-dioxygenase, alpha subunit